MKVHCHRLKMNEAGGVGDGNSRSLLLSIEKTSGIVGQLLAHKVMLCVCISVLQSLGNCSLTSGLLVLGLPLSTKVSKLTAIRH